MKSCAACLAGLLTLFLDPTPSPAADVPAPADVAPVVLPVTYDPLSHPTPMVKLSLNGKSPEFFALASDLGSELVVTQSTVKADGLKAIPARADDVPMANLDNGYFIGADDKALMKTGKLKVEVCEDNDVPTIHGEPIAGEIGFGLIGKVVNQLDLVKKTWTLYANTTDLSSPDTMTLPLIMGDNQEAQTTLTLAPGVDVDLPIRTDYASTTVPFSDIDRLKPAKIGPGSFIANGTSLSFTPKLLLDNVTAGGKPVAPFPVRAVTIDGNLALGLDFLRRYIVTFDAPHNRLLLTDQHAPIHDGMGRSGITLDYSQSGAEVADVDAGSPAEAAGIKVGDEIITIDGRDTGEISTRVSAQLLEGDSGAPATLSVRRPNTNAPMPISFTRGSVFDHLKGYDGLWIADTLRAPLSVIGVQKGSLADQAGIKVEDRITAVNGLDTRSTFDVRDFVNAYNSGTLHIDVRRAGVTPTLPFIITDEAGREGAYGDIASFDRPSPDMPSRIKGTKTHELTFTVVPGHHRPLILARINQKKPMLFMLDTGAARGLLLTASAAQTLGLKGNTDTPDHHIIAPIKSLELLASGELLPVRITEADVKDLAPTDVGTTRGAISGVIGIDALGGYSSKFDYKKHTITLTPGSVHVDPSADVVPLAMTSDGVVSVPVDIGDGSKVDLIVDTGATDTLLPYPVASHSLDAGIDEWAVIVEVSSTYLAPKVKWPTLTIGREAVHDQEVSVIPGTSVTRFMLGSDVLSNFVFTLDLPGKRLILEKPTPTSIAPKKQAKVEWPSGGMILDKPNGLPYFVYAVMPGSPAEKAGVLKDDVIEGINGASTITPDFDASVFNKDKLDLVIWRAGSAKVKEVTLSTQ